MEERIINQRVNPQIKKGQFLWKDELSKQKYLNSLKKKIAEGFYFSDKVISRVVEEIAPAFDEVIEYGKITK